MLRAKPICWKPFTCWALPKACAPRSTPDDLIKEDEEEAFSKGSVRREKPEVTRDLEITAQTRRSQAG